MKSGKKEAEDVGVIKVTPKKERKNLESLEWYKARFRGAELKDGSRGDYVRLTFEILSGVCEDGSSAKGQLVSALASYDTSIDSKFYTFLAGILGKDPEQDEEIDLKPYYGETYEVNVEVEKKKGQSEAYTNVKKIRIPKDKKKTKEEPAPKEKVKVKTKTPDKADKASGKKKVKKK